MTPPGEPAAAAQFSAGWLQLREPFDLAARAAAAAQPEMAAGFERLRAARAGAALQVLDLGCGLGANLRALAPRLGGTQRWRLVDQDAALLAALPETLAHWARQHGYAFADDVADRFADGRAESSANGWRIDGPGFSASVGCERRDLARDLDGLAVAHGGLVTASALLDLVSADWLQRLIARAGRVGASMCWGSSVDGRLQWQPHDADDAAVQALFASHQQRDKGFGAALGPRAPAEALAQLSRAGYHAVAARSDWHVAGDHAAPMRRALLDGIAGAALEQDRSAATRIDAWRARRAASIERATLHVGHLDILALPL